MKVKVGFQEQAKAVVADVSIEMESSDGAAIMSEQLEQTKQLYLKAQLFSAEQTMKKLR